MIGATSSRPVITRSRTTARSALSLPACGKAATVRLSVPGTGTSVTCASLRPPRLPGATVTEPSMRRPSMTRLPASRVGSWPVPTTEMSAWMCGRLSRGTSLPSERTLAGVLRPVRCDDEQGAPLGHHDLRQRVAGTSASPSRRSPRGPAAGRRVPCVDRIGEGRDELGGARTAPQTPSRRPATWRARFGSATATDARRS